MPGVKADGPLIVMTGAFGWGIVGDEAILENTARAVLDRFPESRIRVLHDSSRRLDPSLPLRYIPSLSSWLRLAPTGLGAIGATRLKSLLRRSRFDKLLARAGAAGQSVRRSEAARAIRSADLLILAGGGYLNGYFEHLVLSRCLEAALAAEAGVPVLASGVTVGPGLEEPSLRRLRESLRTCRWIGLRDGAAAPRLGAMPQEAVPDDAFSLGASLPERAEAILRDSGAPERSPRVGVFFHSWPFLPAGGMGSGLGRALAMFAAETRARLILIPMRYGRGPKDPEDDRSALLSMARHPSLAPCKPVVLETPLRAPELKAVAGRMDFNVCTRYHGLVFSLSEGVPCVGLHADRYYALKMSSLLAPAGLADDCIAAEGRGGQELADLLLRAWSKRARPEMPGMREDCLRSLLKRIENHVN